MTERVEYFRGILPAMQVPFNDDYSVDEAELRRFSGWLASHDGIGGLVTNGHTGEVFSLSAEERAQVTRIVADEVGRRVPVVSGICCESITEAVEHALAAEEAGARGLLIMPPHYWLRFGMRPENVVDHFVAVSEAVKISLIVHIYPAWTKASYSSALLAELARLPRVTSFKVGTREMSKYDRDIRAIREANPRCTVLTCHDEYVLASMVQGVDGALVGFASFIPELLVELYEAVCAGDLNWARRVQARISALKEAVYANDEPSSDAHARMKSAMVLAGRLKSDLTRPPTQRPSPEQLHRIERALEEAGLLEVASLPAEAALTAAS
jgi:4-hydroxy-tetrahydrodipicolinate synthase